MITEQTINLSDSAADHVKKILASKKESVGLRLGVKTTGCSGYQYVIDTATSINEKDKIIESNGVQIIVDEKSLCYLTGTTLDFVHKGLNSSFEFKNPRVQDSCGCGKSFSLKEEPHS